MAKGDISVATTTIHNPERVYMDPITWKQSTKNFSSFQEPFLNWKRGFYNSLPKVCMQIFPGPSVPPLAPLPPSQLSQNAALFQNTEPSHSPS